MKKCILALVLGCMVFCVIFVFASRQDYPIEYLDGVWIPMGKSQIEPMAFCLKDSTKLATDAGIWYGKNAPVKDKFFDLVTTGQVLCKTIDSIEKIGKNRFIVTMKGIKNFKNFKTSDGEFLQVEDNFLLEISKPGEMKLYDSLSGLNSFYSLRKIENGSIFENWFVADMYYRFREGKFIGNVEVGPSDKIVTLYEGKYRFKIINGKLACVALPSEDSTTY